jgi:2-amino-4-hydroxy-6-hydroxymethyldihydropteridine diphosphokinase
VTRAFLGLGSNLGDRQQLLAEALAALDDVVGVSDLYETDPIGGVEQDPFLNLVVQLETTKTARDLLEVGRTLEREADRVRKIRWGPRTLDVDVLWVDGETVDEPDLTVPHPRMRERAFVMVPLAELAPDLVGDWSDPGEGEVRNIGRL